MSRLRELVGPAVVLVLVALAVVAVLGRGADVRLVSVLSGSMHPTVPVGALVVTTPVEAGDVAEGDVLAFAPPPPYSTVGDRPVMHRVVAIEDLPDGQHTARTQGDANPQPDPWTLDLDAGGDMARSLAVVPVLGFLTAGGTWATAALLGGLLLLHLRRSMSRRAPEPCTCPPPTATPGAPGTPTA